MEKPNKYTFWILLFLSTLITTVLGLFSLATSRVQVLPGHNWFRVAGVHESCPGPFGIWVDPIVN